MTIQVVTVNTMGVWRLLSSIRRDAEVAPKCPSRSLVMRKKRIVWKGRLRPKREEEEEDKAGKERRVIMVDWIAP